MTKLEVKALDQTNLAALGVLAGLVTGKVDHHDRSVAAKEAWEKIKRQEAPWMEVKKLLVDAGDGVGSCHYCERSAAGQIEHVCPKNHYPELAFDFDNYVFSCGDCNALKSDKWAVIDPATGNVVHLKRAPRKAKSVAPAIGQNLFLNLRKEDPLDYFHLDIDTGKLVPIPILNPVDAAKATYTRDLLDLNYEKPRKSGSDKEKDAFLRARRNRAKDLLRWAEEYDEIKAKNPKDKKLDSLMAELLETPYRMVWYQMVKQTSLQVILSPAVASLKAILQRNPELKTLKP